MVSLDALVERVKECCGAELIAFKQYKRHDTLIFLVKGWIRTKITLKMKLKDVPEESMAELVESICLGRCKA